jgi:uncharacterized membrane protein YiaA
VVGAIDGVWGVHRSDDAGAAWSRFNDDAHRFGGMGIMAADQNIYGRIYARGSPGHVVRQLTPRQPAEPKCPLPVLPVLPASKRGRAGSAKSTLSGSWPMNSARLVNPRARRMMLRRFQGAPRERCGDNARRPARARPSTTIKGERKMTANTHKPTGAFVGAAWLALLAGAGAYLFGLWNAQMQLNEKGYYFVLLMYGLFAAVSLQKTVRDRLEGVPTTGLYTGLCWLSMATCVVLMGAGLYNATLSLAEKGFYAMAFVLALFATVAIQKNVRDTHAAAH